MSAPRTRRRASAILDRFSELQLQTCRPACVFSAELCWLVLDSGPLATGGINLSAVSFPPAFGQGSSRRINTRATSGATSSVFHLTTSADTDCRRILGSLGSLGCALGRWGKRHTGGVLCNCH